MQIDKTSINLRVILAIIVIAIGFHMLLQSNMDDPDGFDFPDILYLSLPLGCAIAGFITAYSYKRKKIPFFGKSYFALGLGFVFWFIGDLVYYFYLFILELDPYPLLESDLFYVFFYACLIYFIISNIKFFQIRISPVTLVYVVGIVLLIFAAYSYVAYVELEEFGFDYFYAILFVVPSSITLAFAVEGTRMFKHSPVKEAWALLGIGISLITLADVWYYYEEIAGNYDDNHVLNSLWFGSFMLIIYSLYIHKKSML